MKLLALKPYILYTVTTRRSNGDNYDEGTLDGG